MSRSPDKIELGYETPVMGLGRAASRRRFAKWVVVGVGFAALLAVVWPFGRAAFVYAGVRHQQDRCLSFHLRAGTIAYAEDPAGLNAMRRFDASPSAPGRSEVMVGRATALPNGGGAWLAGYLIPKAESGLSSFAAGGPSSNMLPVFLHGRRAAPDLPVRLVRVGLSMDRIGQMKNSPALRDGFVFVGRVYAPATWNNPLRQLTVTKDGNAPIEALPFGGLRLYAGQPDAADESHFTIDYQTPDGRGTIDGWLMHDDTVKLEVRDGPAARR